MANNNRKTRTSENPRTAANSYSRWIWLGFPATALAAIAISLLLMNQMKPSLQDIGQRLLNEGRLGNDLLAEIDGKPVPTYSVIGEAPTEAEASETIAAFFTAVEQEDWESAGNLTVGQASLQTDTKFDQYADRRIAVDLQVEQPSIDSVAVEDAETRVNLTYDFAESSDGLLGSLRAAESSGETTFVLVRTAEGVKIADTGTFWLGESA